MSNEYKDYTIKLNCNEAFMRALMLMLRHAQRLGSIGASRDIGMYCDGDGHDRIKLQEHPFTLEELNECSKGIKKDKSFYIDTDEVFNDF